MTMIHTRQVIKSKSLETMEIKNDHTSIIDDRNCHCRKCNPDAWWMIVCSKCGNKRCPHATNHKNECTNSNEPGQEGSVY